MKAPAVYEPGYGSGRTVAESVAAGLRPTMGTSVRRVAWLAPRRSPARTCS